ncbi:hypothetical protein V6N11_065626 [Hibiscus sabdariffa]|uniref:F-box domain-containing protein n=1 Tax=Hibiscus sabdariffa TaxID=183260 RepID=A0ABR2PHV0_9ROSI
MKQVPEEIIVQILSRLPVKSLCRFKCVSKAWRNLISSSQFVKLQLNQSVKSNRLTVYVMCNWLGFPGGYWLHATACCALLFILQKPLSWSIHQPEKPRRFFPNLVPKSKPRLVAGFGYDALHDDYKVVKIDGTVDVYSLKKGAWSCIGDFPHHIIGDAVHLNGVIHWITRYGSETALSITALDLTKQEFHTVSLADLVPVQLYAMGGNLCVGYYRRGQAVYEFWVMEIYGKEESWKRIGLTCRTMPSVLDLPRSQQVLIVTEKCLFIYNQRNGSLKEVSIGQIPKGYVQLRQKSVFSYEDSLVAL